MRALLGLRRFAAAAALLSTLLAAPSYAGLKLELGGDYAFSYGGTFELMLGVNAPIARHIHVGGRFGGLFTTRYVIGAPLDFELLANVADGRAYLGGLLGPWLAFDSGFPLRFHGAFEFGLRAGSLTFGLELGYLQPGPIAGLRLAFQI